MDLPKIKALPFGERISKGVVILFSGVVLCYFSIAVFFEMSFVPQTIQENPVFFKHDALFYTIILFCIFLILMARNIFLKINSKTLFISLSCVYLVAGIYLIVNVGPNPGADSSPVYSGAMAFNQGDFSSLMTGGYLARFPHQLGLATYERIFMIFSTSEEFFYFLNLFMVLIINYTQWKIAEIISQNNTRIINYTIVFSFAFLPQLFLIIFLYGHIPGLCCMIAAVYYMMRYFQSRKLKHCIFSTALIAVSCTLRNNYMIAAIAMCLLYLLDSFRSKRKRCLLIAIVTIICAIVLPKAVNIWYHYESGIDFYESRTPKVLWVTMGLQDSLWYRMGGWFNGYVNEIPEEYNYDYALAQERGLADLQERLNYFQENHNEAFQFFNNKVKSTWLDPSFESIFMGPIEGWGQFVRSHTKLLSDLYNGNGIYWYLFGFMSIVLVVIYWMSLLYMIFAALIKKADLSSEKLFPYIYLLGGFFFHLIWETKSLYVYSYVFMLIPVAACGIDLVGDRLFSGRSTGPYSTHSKRKRRK